MAMDSPMELVSHFSCEAPDADPANAGGGRLSAVESELLHSILASSDEANVCQCPQDSCSSCIQSVPADAPENSASCASTAPPTEAATSATFQGDPLHRSFIPLHVERVRRPTAIATDSEATLEPVVPTPADPAEDSVPAQSNPVSRTPIVKGKVFRRLYNQSTAKKPDSLPMESVQPSLTGKSIHIAQSSQIARIKAAFGDRESATREELLEILTNLGIFRDCSDGDVTLINGVINRCRTDESHFSATRLQQKVADAVLLSRHHKFQILVNAKLTMAHANERAVATPEKPEPPMVMCRSTFERLIAPRKAETPKTKKKACEEPKVAPVHERGSDIAPGVSDEKPVVAEEPPVKKSVNEGVLAVPLVPRARKPWMSMEEIENRVRREIKAAEQKRGQWP
jgi:hypothetical protein